MKKLIMGILAGALLVGTAAAQDDKQGKIQERKEKQQERIAKGIEKGSLTPTEAARLERQRFAGGSEQDFAVLPSFSNPRREGKMDHDCAYAGAVRRLGICDTVHSEPILSSVGPARASR